jgi:DNA replication protein DnaC
MLTEQTIMKLKELNLMGMAAGFSHQLQVGATHDLSFEERFGMVVDSETTYRENVRLKRLLKGAKLKAARACVEDIRFEPKRGLDKSHIASLSACEWITRGQNLLITGPTGSGKTWLACAFGQKACRLGKSVMFQRIPLLLEDLQLSHVDGSFRTYLGLLAKQDLLILDDFGIGMVTSQGRADLLEIVDSRVEGRATIVTSQLPVEKWHEFLSAGNPTAADAILDRMVSGSLRIPIEGDTMRGRENFSSGY